MGKRRRNTFTRWIGDMVDDTKDFVDDLLDRADYDRDDDDDDLGLTKISAQLDAVLATLNGLTSALQALSAAGSLAGSAAAAAPAASAVAGMAGKGPLP